ncbi:hypothetical protein CTI12_AA509480 [Artemisia annua]|uniref:Uncharacterized protein n=1 Tax=Artemisia annua TaxID=35608 RepID=A0A2U1LB70_ARTAN|nr:hypothetical protein CTI12_AA509480 [Artemisia annua]
MRVDSGIGKNGEKESFEGYGEAGKNDGLDRLLGINNQTLLGYKKQKVVWLMIFGSRRYGGKGYGYSQLSAGGNSRGILLICDSRVFTCKEAIGDERFIAMKGDRRGKDEEVFLVCIYGTHLVEINRHFEKY